MPLRARFLHQPKFLSVFLRLYWVAHSFFGYYDDTVKVWHEQYRAVVDAPIPLSVAAWRDALWAI
jgi:hypothetical protein